MFSSDLLSETLTFYEERRGHTDCDLVATVQQVDNPERLAANPFYVSFLQLILCVG